MIYVAQVFQPDEAKRVFHQAHGIRTREAPSVSERKGLTKQSPRNHERIMRLHAAGAATSVEDVMVCTLMTMSSNWSGCTHDDDDVCPMATAL